VRLDRLRSGPRCDIRVDRPKSFGLSIFEEVACMRWGRIVQVDDRNGTINFVTSAPRAPIIAIHITLAKPTTWHDNSRSHPLGILDERPTYDRSSNY
jgi:hypothetical protein